MLTDGHAKLKQYGSVDHPERALMSDNARGLLQNYYHNSLVGAARGGICCQELMEQLSSRLARSNTPWLHWVFNMHAAEEGRPERDISPQQQSDQHKIAIKQLI